MKRTLLAVCIMLMLSSCIKGKAVENQTPGSDAELVLVATTPEGVKVYRLSSGGTIFGLAVSKDGNSVSICQH